MTRHVRKEEGYAFLLIHPLQHLRSELEKARSVSLNEIAKTFVHGLRADYHRIKLHEKVETDHDAHVAMLRKAAKALPDYVDIDGDTVTLKPDADPTKMYWKGSLINPPPPPDPFQDPFAPQSQWGFAEDIRDPKGVRDDKLEALRASMAAVGWLPMHPVVVDENGLVLVGHRRLRVAKELGIDPTPHTVTVPCGEGIEGVANRFDLSFWSNVGSKPLSKEDLRRATAWLLTKSNYKGEPLTYDEIAAIIGKSRDTVKRIVNELGANAPNYGNTIQERKGPGRPRGTGKKKRPLTGLQQRAIKAAIDIKNRGEEVTEKSIREEGDVGPTPARAAMAAIKLIPDDDDPLRKWIHERAALASTPMMRSEMESFLQDARAYLDSTY